MGAFDIGGKIVIAGEFDGVFDQLDARAQEAERSLGEIELPRQAGGDEFLQQLEADLEAAKALEEQAKDIEVNLQTQDARDAIRELEDELAKFQAQVKAGAPVTVTDLEAFRQAQAYLADLKRGMAAVEGGSQAAGMSVGGLVKGLAGLSIAGFGAKKIADLTMELATLGAQAIDTENAFAALTASKGIDADALLGGLEEAAKGATGSSQLILAANRAIMAGGEEMASKLPQLYDAARVSAMLTGRDTASAFDGIVQSIANFNERGLRTQGIYVDLNQAAEEYASANGRTVQSLSDVERRQVATNAVIAAATPLYREMGLEAASASEKMASLPVAIADVKEELGKLIAEQGAVDMLARLADSLQGGTRQAQLGQDLVEVQKGLRAIGDDDALARLNAEYEALLKQKGPISIFGSNKDELAAFQDEQRDALEALIGKYSELVSAQHQADNPELFKTQAANAGAAAEQTSSFAQALTEARDRLASVATLEGQFASAVASAGIAMQSMPEMPDITALMDTDALRAWGDAWLAVNPNLAEARGQLEQTAIALGENQQRLFAQAAGISDMDERLRFLTTGFFGAGASVETMISALGGLSPEMLAQIGPIDDVAMAVARLRAQADQPITIDVAIRNQAAILNDIESLSVRIQDIYGTEKAREFYDAATRENAEYWQSIGDQDALGTRLATEQFTGYLEDIVNAADPAMHKVQESATKAFEAIGRSAGELKGDIERALMEGSTVTAEDMAAALAGTYDDAPLEAARRLDAIAARGFAEIKAHPDWAGLLEIPADVLSGSEDSLKAWAARTAGAVRDLTRPDLIDWDAFVASFEQGLKDVEARKITIDMAFEKLDAAGLLSGSPEEQREQVLKALGLEAPEVSFTALLEAEANAGSKLSDQVGPITFEALMGGVSEIALPEDTPPLAVPVAPDETPDSMIANWMAGLSPDYSVKLPVELVAQGAVDTAGVLPEDAGGEPVDMTAMFDVAGSQSELQSAGGQAWDYVQAGASAALLTSDIASATVVKWGTDFAGNAEAFGNIGKAAGNKVGDGILTAIDEKVGEVIDRIASAVAPEVAAILKRNGPGVLP